MKIESSSDLIDELGMPFPVVPVDIPPDISQAWNRDHGHYTAKRFLNGTEGTRAVRFSRLQFLPVYLHDRKHRMLPNGIEVPPSEFEEFKLTILGFGGYVPKLGINVSGSEPTLTHLSRRQRQALKRPGIITTELDRPSANQQEVNTTVGNFLIGYALRHGLDNVAGKTQLVEKFMEAPNREQKMAAGLDLIGKAAEVASEPFDDIYRSAYTHRAFRGASPSCPQTAIRAIMSQGISNYTELLASNLEQIAA